MLSVDGIDVFYGNVRALRNVSFEIGEGEMTALVGPNGAGKTTTLRTISGLTRPASGSITFDGERIDLLSPELMVEIGIAHVPEGRGIFPGLTVMENLRMGHFVRRKNDDFEQGVEFVLARFPLLEERTGQLAGTLSGGEQQMLALGRALLSRPKLLLIDEPSLGLAPVVVGQLFKTLQEINAEQGTAMLFVEQFVNLALRFTHRAHVLTKGEIRLSGASSDLRSNAHLISASYLGGEPTGGNGRASGGQLASTPKDHRGSRKTKEKP